MKQNYLLFLSFVLLLACTSGSQQNNVEDDQAITDGGQSTVQDDESQKNIVQIAVASPDHKTLVTALKAADYVDVLANAGPFTVFAPTDAAFSSLPAGTIDDLVKPENKNKLRDILEYHVYVGVIRENMFQDGVKLNQVNTKDIVIAKTGEKVTVNGASVLSSISTSNGIIYVIDQVLLPE